ncbi:MAG: two-component, sigma-54 specific, transcriptional regulator, Fis family [Proteobacteria bacterium]|nr:two-component, sigma-54 specific, transcriptional regulator, Fis family [Pseudomonadota bacterium]
MSHALLIIEDEVVLAKNIRIYFERAGYEVRAATSAEDGLRELDLFKPDVVLLDYQLPGMNGIEMLAALRKIDPAIKVVMLTGQGSVDLAVQAMKLGATDFLTKPVVLEKMRLLLEKLFSEEQSGQVLSYYHSRDSRQSGINLLIGESAPMRELKATLSRLLAAEAALGDDAPPAVLITGETGSGKEVLARALHFEGPRRNGPFIELNCGTIPTQLLESELFGYERGAFTDAKEKKIGLVQAADGGTLFLDEIGDMGLPLQVKLLKMLEEKIVRPLGSVRDRKVNVRIVAATHQPLEQFISDGRFRSDLYFRLRIVQLHLPPLRERGHDILLLARHFLAQQSARYGKPDLRFAADAEAALLRHRWRGNVRELRNLIEQTVLLASEPVIRAAHMAFFVMPEAGSTVANGAALADLAPASLHLDEVERDLIVKALDAESWNVTKAARLLGISRDTLRYRMEKHQLNREM